MSTEERQAAWQRQPGQPLELGPVEPTEPGKGEILVRNAAVAINPIDWLMQDSAIFPWVHYPTILGSDVAGEVVAVGAGVTRFRVGSRVLGQGVATATNRAAEGAFQTHTLLLEDMAAPIPDGMPFSDAAVLPLGVGTAACGLYQKDFLGLNHPSLSPVSAGEVVLVWGGSSSVGCNAVQLVVASGYECVAVASPRTFDLVRGLGASQVLDYGAADIVDQVVETLRGKTLAGAYHAKGDIPACLAVVSRCDGRRFVAATLELPEDRPAGVEAKQIFGNSLKNNEVSRAVYVDFLGDALASGRYRIAPTPRVVGHGLDDLQAALDAQNKGVSAEKIVVSLADG